MNAIRFLSLLLCGYLGIYQGHVALFMDGQVQPVQVFPQSIHWYPEADREALLDGIPFETEAQLHRLLEDYLS